MGKSVVGEFLSLAFVALCLFQNVGFGGKEIEGTVSKNVDGDTIWAETNEGRLKIRFHDIDAPETHLPAPGGVVGQGKWGTSAAEWMAEAIPVGTEVALRDEGLDTYKRTLGHVLLDGDDIGLEMVRAGWAIPYVICEGEDCTEEYLAEEKVSELFEACESARRRGVGIFNAKSPLKEMPFEFRLRVQKRQPDKYVGDFDKKIYFRPNDYNRVDLCRRVFFMKLKDAQRLGYRPASGRAE